MNMLVFYICVLFSNILFSSEFYKEDSKHLNNNISDSDLIDDTKYHGTDIKMNDSIENCDYFDSDQFLLEYLHEHQLFGINSILKHFHELFPDIEVKNCIDINDWIEDLEELFRYGLYEKDILHLSVSQIKEKFQRIEGFDKKNEYLLELFKIYSLKNKNEEVEQLLDLLINENDEFQVMAAREWIHRNIEKSIYGKFGGDSQNLWLPLWIPPGAFVERDHVKENESCGFFYHEDLYEKNYKDKALVILVDLYCKQGQISKAENTMHSIKSLDERLGAYKSLMKIYAKTKTPQEILKIHEKYFMKDKIKEKPISNLYWLSSHMWGKINYPEIFECFLEAFLRNNSIEELKIYIRPLV